MLSCVFGVNIYVVLMNGIRLNVTIIAIVTASAGF